LLCGGYLKRHDASVKASVYAYVDVVRLWIRRPLSRKEWGWVNGEVGHPLLGYPFKIQQGGRQRLLLTQPSEACLRFFAERDDVTINYAEIALDSITPHASEMKREVRVGFLQRWHGTRQVTIFTEDEDNFRTADRGCRGLSFQAYDTKPSKVTGEVDCFHLEAWINGVRALRQLGISSLSDLLVFDHARFWQRYFVIAAIDMERLGRFHTNLRDGTRRRPLMWRSESGFIFNTDAAVGNVLWRVFGAVPNQPHYSLQRFLKAYASHLGVPPYIIACRTTNSTTAYLLHRFAVIPGPDLSLLRPELRYPLRPRGRGQHP
jgi:hypothetical protein